MINGRFFYSLLFLFIIVPTYAQEKNAFLSPQGKWTFALYSGNIVKTTLQPINYLHNEQVSNAVIAGPVDFTTPYKNFAVDISSGKINYYHQADTLFMLNYFDSGVCKGFRFQLKNNEKVFGTGERSLPLDRRG